MSTDPADTVDPLSEAHRLSRTLSVITVLIGQFTEAAQQLKDDPDVSPDYSEGFGAAVWLLIGSGDALAQTIRELAATGEKS